MQAIDRTHRLGQFKPIYATRFIIEDTVEERIIKLQASVWLGQKLLLPLLVAKHESLGARFGGVIHIGSEGGVDGNILAAPELSLSLFYQW